MRRDVISRLAETRRKPGIAANLISPMTLHSDLTRDTLGKLELLECDFYPTLHSDVQRHAGNQNEDGPMRFVGRFVPTCKDTLETRKIRAVSTFMRRFIPTCRDTLETTNSEKSWGASKVALFRRAEIRWKLTFDSDVVHGRRFIPTCRDTLAIFDQYLPEKGVDLRAGDTAPWILAKFVLASPSTHD
ncbi:MAG: hypothetical protein MZV64_09950 [Ignavibacteriales bacterium]|nr:hypothetical protein [Ignavibacteriales bacterium]